MLREDVLISMLESNAALVDDATLADWIELAKRLKRDSSKTTKPWWSMKARIQVLVTEAGLISNQDFIEQTEV